MTPCPPTARKTINSIDHQSVLLAPHPSAVDTGLAVTDTAPDCAEQIRRYGDSVSPRLLCHTCTARNRHNTFFFFGFFCIFLDFTVFGSSDTRAPTPAFDDCPMRSVHSNPPPPGSEASHVAVAPIGSSFVGFGPVGGVHFRRRAGFNGQCRARALPRALVGPEQHTVGASVAGTVVV